MRNFLLTLILCLIASLTVQAGEFGYLVFTNTAGVNTSMKVDNLSFSVSGSQLQVTNVDGSVNFALADLQSMHFSVNDESDTALDNVLDADRPVQVFTLTGTSLGTFDNLVQAALKLGAGTYVIVNGKNAQTIVIQ